MSTEVSKKPQSSDSQYYDAQYYKDHFGYVSEGKDYLALAEYWKYSIFTKNSLNPDARILDYGCGLGQVSAALPNTMCYDPSAYARTYLKARKRVVVDSPEQIPACQFDFLISSHSLEHSSTPAEDLRRFRRFMKPSGRLILILPIEEDWEPRLEPDSN